MTEQPELLKEVSVCRGPACRWNFFLGPKIFFYYIPSGLPWHSENVFHREKAPSAHKLDGQGRDGLVSLPHSLRNALVARYLHVVRDGILHLAVMASVAEVNGHSNRQPHDQTKPRVAREAGHQGEGNHDTQDGDQRHQRRLEGTMQLGTAHPENPHTGAYDDERQQGSDAHQRSEEHTSELQ